MRVTGRHRPHTLKAGVGLTARPNSPPSFDPCSAPPPRHRARPPHQLGLAQSAPQDITSMVPALQVVWNLAAAPRLSARRRPPAPRVTRQHRNGTSSAASCCSQGPDRSCSRGPVHLRQRPARREGGRTYLVGSTRPTHDPRSPATSPPQLADRRRIPKLSEPYTPFSARVRAGDGASSRSRPRNSAACRLHQMTCA